VSAIDGRQVEYRNRSDYKGHVIGDSHTLGNVRVAWTEPYRQIGIHRIEDLVVVDEPPTQEQLAALL
jgi:hypothetical protein